MESPQNTTGNAPRPTPVTASLAHTYKMTGWALLFFSATLLLPLLYDQLNLVIFRQAEAADELMIREYAPQILTTELAQNASSQIPASSAESIALKVLLNKRLIAADYVHQMHQVRDLTLKTFFKFFVALTIILALTSLLVFQLLLVRGLRTIAIAALFMSMVLSIHCLGLPHTNYKFHGVFTFVYAILLSLIDLLFMYDLQLPPLPKESTGTAGYLSSLQYKHRYWLVLFNIAVVTVLAMVLTTSFIIFQTFCIVFGEGFAAYPLLGVFMALTFIILGTLFGVLKPICQHLAKIETAMAYDCYK